MSSNQSSVSDYKSELKASDATSILSTSTTSSMSGLLKSKFTSKSKKSKSTSPEEELTPAQKQARRRADRMSYVTLATIASMK